MSRHGEKLLLEMSHRVIFEILLLEKVKMSIRGKEIVEMPHWVFYEIVVECL